MPIPFTVVIDDLLPGKRRSAFSTQEKNYLLSLINGFEDGKWRINHFENYVWDNIGETALSFQERQSLQDNSYTRLVTAARNLRLSESPRDVGGGSEIAEILLYAIMKHRYGALPVVPKIFYKQNSQDYAKGADSVHIVLEGENDFSLWLGEAKFFNSIEDTRFEGVLNSIAEMLSANKIKKENSIITNTKDLEHCSIPEETLEAIRALLSNDTSIDHIKPKLQIPILLLHECELTKSSTEESESYLSKIHLHHSERATKFFLKKLAKLGHIHKFKEIRFHLLLIPVHNKGEIVSRFKESVANFRK
jgi:hypothetical protein